MQTALLLLDPGSGAGAHCEQWQEEQGSAGIAPSPPRSRVRDGAGSSPGMHGQPSLPAAAHGGQFLVRSMGAGGQQAWAQAAASPAQLRYPPCPLSQPGAALQPLSPWRGCDQGQAGPRVQALCPSGAPPGWERGWMCSGRNGVWEWLFSPGFAAGQTDSDAQRLLFYPCWHQCQLWTPLCFTQGARTHRGGSQG